MKEHSLQIEDNSLDWQKAEPARGSARLLQTLFLKLLGRFNKGELTVILPDGQRHCFGSGPEPKGLLKIHNKAFFRQVLFYGEIGFGESYMAGDWSSPDVTKVLHCFIANLETVPGMSGSEKRFSLFNFLDVANRAYHWLRRNTRRNSRRNIQAHYDLSNEFYRLWLDPTWTYSSAYFERPDQELADAQQSKYRKLARSLGLRPGMEVLEIGCGWGGFALLAAREFGVKLTCVTLSEEQLKLSRERIAAAGLQDRVEVRLQDYREIKGQFDAIVSIEMLEAVGHHFLHDYFQQCHRLLKPTGRLGLQVILCPDSRYDAMRKSVDWIKRHIFPGGQLPSYSAIQHAVQSTGDLFLQGFDSFGNHYAQTLKIWRKHFNERLDSVYQLGFDETFARKWDYYLAYCEAAFASHNITVSQMVFSRPNNREFLMETQPIG
ncbi:MAG: class I SAM-dependent methyltransferase [Opitutales bacterium]|nr:class I SAM-dependent methyltransferase [Opitutales bacterium]